MATKDTKTNPPAPRSLELALRYDDIRNRINEELESSLGEINAAVEAMEEELARAGVDIADKLGAYRFVLRHNRSMVEGYKSQAAQYKAYADEMAKRAKALENIEERLKQRALDMMSVAGLDSVEVDGKKVWLAATQSVDVPADVDLTELWDMGATFVEQRITLDKAAFKDVWSDLYKTDEAGKAVEVAGKLGIRVVERTSIRGLV